MKKFQKISKNWTNIFFYFHFKLNLKRTESIPSGLLNFNKFMTFFQGRNESRNIFLRFMNLSHIHTWQKSYSYFFFFCFHVENFTIQTLWFCMVMVIKKHTRKSRKTIKILSSLNPKKKTWANIVMCDCGVVRELGALRVVWVSVCLRVKFGYFLCSI